MLQGSQSPKRICEHYVTHLLLPTEGLKEHHTFSSCNNTLPGLERPQGEERAGKRKWGKRKILTRKILAVCMQKGSSHLWQPQEPDVCIIEATQLLYVLFWFHGPESGSRGLLEGRMKS